MGTFLEKQKAIPPPLQRASKSGEITSKPGRATLNYKSPVYSSSHGAGDDRRDHESRRHLPRPIPHACLLGGIRGQKNSVDAVCVVLTGGIIVGVGPPSPRTQFPDNPPGWPAWSGTVVPGHS